MIGETINMKIDRRMKYLAAILEKPDASNAGNALPDPSLPSDQKQI